VAPQRVGFALGLCCAAAEAGFLVASAVADALEENMDDEAMLNWGWRVPFLLSLPLGLVVLYLQHTAVEESEEFEQAASATDRPLTRSEHEARLMGSTMAKPYEPTQKEAVRDGSVFGWLWTHHRVPLLLALLLLGQNSTMGYGAVIFAKDFLTHIGRRSVSEAAKISTTMYIVSMLTDPVAGLVADAYGFVRAATVAVLFCAVLALPAWLLLVSPGNLVVPFLGAALMASLWCMMKVPFTAIAIGLFPTAVRATGVGIAINGAQLIFAAAAPVINNVMWEALEARPHNGFHTIFLDSLAPAIWLYVGVLASATGLCGVAWAARRGSLRTVSYLRVERFFSMCESE